MVKCFLLFFLFCSSVFGSTAENNLKKLSLNDRICMKAFFDEATYKDQAAHVIFFKNKPVCFTGPALRYPQKTLRDRLALRGWQAFKKNENLFPHPNFIFSACVEESGKDFKMLNIFIINKQSLMKCINDHIDLFKTTLGQDFNGQEMIVKLEEGYPLTSLIKKNEMLLGVLLGYGAESSKAFTETNAYHTGVFAPPHTDFYRIIDLKKPKGCKIHPVVFMGDPHSPEVQKLVHIYEKELEEIAQIYHKPKDSLKIVLEKLCEP